MTVIDHSEEHDRAPTSALQPRQGSSLRQGDLLAGKYRIERVVGAGGMGEVLAATHMGLQQEVAIKIMLADKVRDGDSVERFLREARAAVMLKSSHVARVFDVATTDAGLPYIVMELLDGKDLVTVLDESGPLPHADVAEVMVQVCDAVAEAHGLGIIHRDLKPENFFLSRRRDGAPLVKVLDFGISKLGIEATTHHSRRIVTQENTVLGSPTYMSPEQVKNSKRVDERSDIWSLGVSMYELLTAVEPFTAESIPEIFVNVLTALPTPPHQILTTIPPELSAIVMRCLEKEPAARFQNIRELATALQQFTSGKSLSVAPTWGDESKGPDSSSSLVSRLSPITGPQFQPMPLSAAMRTSPTLDAAPSPPNSAGTPMSVSATIAETTPAKSSRALLVVLALVASVALIGGAAWWRLRPSPVVAPPSTEATAAPSAEPAAPSAEPAVVAQVVAAPSASLSASLPSPSAARGPRPASPRPVSKPRHAPSPKAPAPSATGLPRERTSW